MTKVQAYQRMPLSVFRKPDERNGKRETRRSNAVPKARDWSNLPSHVLDNIIQHIRSGKVKFYDCVHN